MAMTKSEGFKLNIHCFPWNLHGEGRNMCSTGDVILFVFPAHTGLCWVTALFLPQKPRPLSASLPWIHPRCQRWGVPSQIQPGKAAPEHNSSSLPTHTPQMPLYEALHKQNSGGKALFCLQKRHPGNESGRWESSGNNGIMLKGCQGRGGRGAAEGM